MDLNQSTYSHILHSDNMYCAPELVTNYDALNASDDDTLDWPKKINSWPIKTFKNLIENYSTFSQRYEKEAEIHNSVYNNELLNYLNLWLIMLSVSVSK